MRKASWGPRSTILVLIQTLKSLKVKIIPVVIFGHFGIYRGRGGVGLVYCMVVRSEGVRVSMVFYVQYSRYPSVAYSMANVYSFQIMFIEFKFHFISLLS